MGSTQSNQGNKWFIVTPATTVYPPGEAAATTVKMYGSGPGVVQSKSAVKAKRKVLLVTLFPLNATTSTIGIRNYEGNQPAGSEYESLTFSHVGGAPVPPAELNLELRNGISASIAAGGNWLVVYRQLDDEDNYKLPTT